MNKYIDFGDFGAEAHAHGSTPQPRASLSVARFPWVSLGISEVFWGPGRWDPERKGVIFEVPSIWVLGSDSPMTSRFFLIFFQVMFVWDSPNNHPTFSGLNPASFFLVTAAHNKGTLDLIQGEMGQGRHWGVVDAQMKPIFPAVQMVSN